jgi:hypothetical protein
LNALDLSCMMPRKCMRQRGWSNQLSMNEGYFFKRA